jgi:hypothetical protein
MRFILNNRFWFLLFIIFTLSPALFARGNVEETEVQKDEWVLCISQFDSSNLPENKSSVSNVIMRKLTESLSNVNYRTRVSPEYAYYEKTAWERERSNAAKALADKQNERSLLVYKGEAEWRYRRNMERADAEIEKLRIALREVEESVPAVDREPVFALTSDSLELKFPAAPKTGGEYKFCIDQKIDAVLTGSIIDFHERFLVTMKLYTIYTQSFAWEDSIVFSHDDIDDAMEEITRRLVVVLSGNKPAIFAVRTEPEDALVLINRSFTGRGGVSLLEYPPGTVTITASAPDHESLTFNMELFPGDLALIGINLKPIIYGNVDIAGDVAGSVYQGALYAGESPLSLRLPLNKMEYIELESPEEARGTLVFQSPEYAEFNQSLFLPTSIPPAKGQVDKARRMYYWAWGGTWITGIAAWLSYQYFLSSNYAVAYSYRTNGAYDQKFFDDNIRIYNISRGALIAVGSALLFDIIFMGRYLYTANKGSMPVMERGNK